MDNRKLEIRKMLDEVRQHISIPAHIEYEAALESEDERLIAIFDSPFAEELLTKNALSLKHLFEAKTLAELTALIDNYTAITHFFKKHYLVFSNIISTPFFRDLIDRKGDLECWNEIMQHSYKKLSYHQSTVLIIDALTRFHAASHHHNKQAEDHVHTHADGEVKAVKKATENVDEVDNAARNECVKI